MPHNIMSTLPVLTDIGTPIVTYTRIQNLLLSKNSISVFLNDCLTYTRFSLSLHNPWEVLVDSDVSFPRLTRDPDS